MKKVSVIIPCYNVEEFIVRCLKSIEIQSFGMKDLEVILINDGSTDNTVSYLNAFKDKYGESVIVIDFKYNRGISVVRNAGLKMASGEYVLFVDSDDTIDKYAIEKLYNKAIEYDCDLVDSTYKVQHQGEEEISRRVGEDWYKELDSVENRRWYIMHMHKLVLWGKLWKNSFLKSNNLLINENCKMSEDVYLTGIAMFLLKKVYFINEQLYYYYTVPDSMSRHSSYNVERNHGVITACDELIEELKRRKIYDEAMSEYKNELGWYIIGPAYFYTMQNVYKEIEFYTKSILNIFPDILENSHLQILDATHAEWMRHFKR